MDVNARREAAEALRAIKRGGEGWYSLSDAVLGRPAPRDEVVARLADLIDPGEDTTVSAYDLLSDEDREALDWVRELYGVENAKIRLDYLDHENDELRDENEFLCDSLNRVCEVLGLPDADRFVSNDGYGSVRADMLNELQKRLMPAGCEWPRFEDGEFVQIGDEVICNERCSPANVNSIEFCRDMIKFYDHQGLLIAGARLSYGERVKRPPVLAADGEPLEVGQTVWVAENGNRFHVVRLCDDGLVQGTLNGYLMNYLKPDQLTHQRPVLDAGGVPIREGDTVYGTVEGGPFIVTEVSDKGSVFVDAFPDTGMHGSMLTHTKPEPPDSWERLEKDAAGIERDCGGTWHKPDGSSVNVVDLVRRAKALAERERGE